MHKCDLRLGVVAAKGLVVVDHQTVGDVLAVEAGTLVALYDDWNVVVFTLSAVDELGARVFGFTDVVDCEGTEGRD